MPVGGRDRLVVAHAAAEKQYDVLPAEPAVEAVDATLQRRLEVRVTRGVTLGFQRLECLFGGIVADSGKVMGQAARRLRSAYHPQGHPVLRPGPVDDPLDELTGSQPRRSGLAR